MISSRPAAPFRFRKLQQTDRLGKRGFGQTKFILAPGYNHFRGIIIKSTRAAKNVKFVAIIVIAMRLKPALIRDI
jgi:hypothetical protein